MTITAIRTKTNRFTIEITGDGRRLVEEDVDAWQLLHSAEVLIHAATGVVVNLDADGKPE